MNNSEMKANRFARWAYYRALERQIREQFEAGRYVVASTYLRRIKLTAKNNGNLKATRNGLWIQNGKSWQDISLCTITAH